MPKTLKERVIDKLVAKIEKLEAKQNPSNSTPFVTEAEIEAAANDMEVIYEEYYHTKGKLQGGYVSSAHIQHLAKTALEAAAKVRFERTPTEAEIEVAAMEIRNAVEDYAAESAYLTGDPNRFQNFLKEQAGYVLEAAAKVRGKCQQY